MGAVDGLGFHGGIPPGIVEHHRVGRGQVQSDAAGFQADKNERHLARLEPGDRLLARLGLAGEFGPADAPAIEFGLDQVEHGRELAEEDDPAPLRDHLLQQR